MITIGCIGLSGSGKSNTCLIFEYFNIYNINIDSIYNKFLLNKSDKIKNDLNKCFDEKNFFYNNIMLKKNIINIIFNNKFYLKCFNNIIKKNIINVILNKIIYFKTIKKRDCIIDAPLLFEYNLDKLCDVILLIKCKLNIRLKRLLLREPNINLIYIKKRMQFQYNENFYSNKYKNIYYINNNSNEFELFLNIKFFIRKIIFK